jgi:hypothetical protein
MKNNLKLLVAFMLVMLWPALAVAQTPAPAPAPLTWQAWVLFLWPVITGLASLGAAALDKTTVGHAVLSFLASIGLDLPKLLDALKRALSPETRAAMRAAAAKTLVVFALVGLVLGGTQSCTPAQWAQAGQTWADILSGLEHGHTIEQIELQVAKDNGFGGVVNTIVVTLVVDAIDEMIALGIIPPQYIPAATAMGNAEAAKLVRLGGHPLHAMRSLVWSGPAYAVAQ